MAVSTLQNDRATLLSGGAKTSGSIEKLFRGTAGYKANNTAYIEAPLPFVIGANYSVTVNSCTLITYASVPTSSVVVDNKDANGIRFKVTHSGTSGRVYPCEVGVTITVN